MNENFAIQLFEGKQVRIVWDAEKEKYYFAVADIVEILSESKDVKQYVKRMRARDPESPPKKNQMKQGFIILVAAALLSCGSRSVRYSGAVLWPEDLGLQRLRPRS